ncbi:hypothetical protein [Paraglaciecola sp. 25GB23A]|jgi:tetratricopeptide (TPR) repeat protein|uniref:hypothetical protein n=1 Tax=Paraglaciecola sp. 25GB23A TaxID=3156068 RepID=UPI0032AED014
MSIEILLVVIVILLAAILLMQILNYRVQVSSGDVIKIFSQQLDARRKETHKDLGDLIEEGNFEKLLSIIDARIEKEPQNSGLYWYKGIALFHLKRWSKAKDVFNQTISIDPRYKKELEEHFKAIEQNEKKSI